MRFLLYCCIFSFFFSSLSILYSFCSSSSSFCFTIVSYRIKIFIYFFIFFLSCDDNKYTLEYLSKLAERKRQQRAKVEAEEEAAAVAAGNELAVVNPFAADTAAANLPPTAARVVKRKKVAQK